MNSNSLGGVEKFEPVSGDGEVDLEMAEHALDAVALLVELPVMVDLHPAV